MHSANLPAAVIFDCDGVLVDTEPLHHKAFQEALRPLGIHHDYQYYLDHFMGYDDRDAFMEVFKECGLTVEDNLLANLIEAKSRALLKLVSSGIHSFPGVVSLVKELLASGVALAVASGSRLREVEMFVEALGLEQVFSLIVSADDVKRSKPDPETYTKAVSGLRKRHGIADVGPRRFIAIEDTPAGIRAAKAGGVYAVGVAHSYSCSRLVDADFVVENMTQLTLNRLIQLMDTPGA